MKKVTLKADSAPKNSLKEIMALPPLEEKGFSQVDPRQALICLQGEYGIFDGTPHGQYPIEYVGTKRLFNCIFVVIKNESNEYFFTHITSNMQPKYFLGINRFKKGTRKLEVTLIGGMPSRNDVLLSEKLLLRIIAELIKLAGEYQITVIGQRLNEHNFQKLSKISSPPEFDQLTQDEAQVARKQIYQFFSDVVQTLYLYLYGCTFNSAFINIRFPTPDSLKKEKELDPTKKDLIKKFVTAARYVSGKMPLEVLRLIRECPGILPDVKGKDEQAQKKARSQARQNFYQLVSDTMTKAGLEFMFSANYGHARSHLTDFVIELKTGHIFSVPRHIKTYNEELRTARYYQDVTQAFLFFLGQHYQPILLLGLEFERKYEPIKKLIQKSNYINSDSQFKLKPDYGLSNMYLRLFHFKQQWKKQAPSLSDYHVSILSDSLAAIFTSNKLGLKDSQALLISEYATEPCCTASTVAG